MMLRYSAILVGLRVFLLTRQLCEQQPVDGDARQYLHRLRCTENIVSHSANVVLLDDSA